MFLALFSLWVTSTLTAAESGLHATQSLRVEPRTLYGADGAMEQAIQRVRYDSTRGVDGGASCDSGPFRANGRDYFVRCQPEPGSGIQTLGGSSPDLGILTLATVLSGEVGYVQDANRPVRLDGGLYSNSSVELKNTAGNQLNLCSNNQRTVPDGILTKNSEVFTSATARFVPADVGAPIKATIGIPAGTTIVDYGGPTTVTMSKKATWSGATPTMTGQRVTFRQDYPPLQSHCIVDQPLLETPVPRHGMITALSACNKEGDKIVAVPDDRTGAVNCPNGLPNPAIGDDPEYVPDPVLAMEPPLPACTANRVLAFAPGRYKDLSALNALGRSCGQPNAEKIFWFTPGSYFFDFSSSCPQPPLDEDCDPAWILDNPYTTFVAGAKIWDETKGSSGSSGVFRAKVAKENGKGGLYYLETESNILSAADVGKYVSTVHTPGIGSSLPYGTRIVASSYNDGANLALQPPPGVTLSSVSSGPFVLSSQEALCDKRANAQHLGVQFIFGGPSRLEVTGTKVQLCSGVAGNRQQVAVYGVKLGNPGIGTLTPQRGRVAKPYSASSNATAVITSAGNDTVFLVLGTIYVPASAVDIHHQTATYQIVSRGIVARAVRMGVSPSAQFTEPLIYSPDFGQRPGQNPRVVVLTACADHACSANGIPKLRARVTITDEDAHAVPYPGLKLTVDSWAVVR